MDTVNIATWKERQEWAEHPAWAEFLSSGSADTRFVFRGQSSNAWDVNSSLARHLRKNSPPVRSKEWRRRELKMYQMFRERVRKLCPQLYDNWEPVEVLSIMRHHHVPTRVIDFTESPMIAAYFAVCDAKGDGAIWVVDRQHLDSIRDSCKLSEYTGPTHIGGYAKATSNGGATIVKPNHLHARTAAQRGCLLIPGHISEPLSEKLIHAKIVLREALILETKLMLPGYGFTKDSLFPDLERIGAEVTSFSTSPNPDYP